MTQDSKSKILLKIENYRETMSKELLDKKEILVRINKILNLYMERFLDNQELMQELLDGIMRCNFFLKNFTADANCLDACLMCNSPYSFFNIEEINFLLSDGAKDMINIAFNFKNQILFPHTNIFSKLKLIKNEILIDKDIIKVALIQFAEIIQQVQPEEVIVQNHLSELAKEILIPLTHITGLDGIKTILEDRCMEITNCKEYMRILKANMKRLEEIKKKFLEDFCKKIKDDLAILNVKMTMSHRTKSVNSIWKKIETQNMEHSDLHDYIGARIILDSTDKDEVELCYAAYRIICSRYNIDHKKTRDWLANPKDSGYKAIHVTLRYDLNILIEIQIRSMNMHKSAEEGTASHWNYKGASPSEINFNDDIIKTIKNERANKNFIV